MRETLGEVRLRKRRPFRSKSLNERVPLPGFPPLQCARIVEPACLGPVLKGLHVTYRSSEDLARQAVTNHRYSDLIEHTVYELVVQRTHALALGYEDLDDHDDLRSDPFLATAVGKADEGRRSRMVAAARQAIGAEARSATSCS